MTVANDQNLMNGNQDELFAEAIERVEAGEPASDVLMSMPAALRPEMSELLTIFGITQEIRSEPIVPLSPEASALGKRDFLAAAALMRSDAVAPGSQPHERTQEEQPGWLAGLWLGLQSLFEKPQMGLASLAVALVIALIASTAFVNITRAALPGDLTYPLKEWVRYQQFSLAAQDQKDEVIDRQAKEISEEIMLVAAREYDQNSAVIEESAILPLIGIGKDRYQVGEILVSPRYQADGNIEEFLPMSVEGDLQEGAIVRLVYRILPGQTGGDGPALVQGVSMKVLDPPD